MTALGQDDSFQAATGEGDTRAREALGSAGRVLGLLCNLSH